MSPYHMLGIAVGVAIIILFIVAGIKRWEAGTLLYSIIGTLFIAFAAYGIMSLVVEKTSSLANGILGAVSIVIILSGMFVLWLFITSRFRPPTEDDEEG